MIYLDTSVIVSSLTMESASSRTNMWFAAQNAGTLYISPWVETEFVSALGLKLRQGTMSQADNLVAIRAFRKLAQEHCGILGISSRHFEMASEYLVNHHLGLRAADALHLAIADDHGAAICTLDQTLYDAASALGIACIKP